jgi:hypothetical protein
VEGFRVHAGTSPSEGWQRLLRTMAVKYLLKVLRV